MIRLHLFHRLFNEVIDAVAVPIHLAESSVDDTVELVKVRSHQRLFHRQELEQNVVVHVDNEVKVACPPSEDFDLFVNLQRTVWHGESQQKEVFNFSEKLDQGRVKVDAEKAVVEVTDKKR